MTDTEHEYDEHGNLLWINTDKYEWDSKCRMVVIDGKLYQRGSNGDYLLSLHDEPVAQIVADAPLLLEEVQRLREGIEQLYESIGTMEIQGNIAIRKALKELIE